MTTARERMKTLSGLLGAHSAREHFLAITQGTGAGVDRFIFASQMTVCVEEPQVTLVQRPAERNVSTKQAETTTAQQDKPNRITAQTRLARIDVTTRSATLYVAQKPAASVFVRTLPTTISTRRKRVVKTL